MFLGAQSAWGARHHGAPSRDGPATHILTNHSNHLGQKRFGGFLHKNGETSGSRITFLNLLRSCFGVLEKRRGLIVDAFTFCGLFLLNRHAIKPFEFGKSRAFGSERDDQLEHVVSTATRETLDPISGGSCSQPDMEPSTSASIRKVFEVPRKFSMRHIR